jgi:hypothetical protein
MTDFFTLCWRSVRLEPAALLLCVPLLVLLPWRLARCAETCRPMSPRCAWSARRGFELYANVRLDLPAAVRMRWSKGIPMVFLAEAEVMRQPLVLVGQEGGQRAAPHAPGLPAADAALAPQCGLRADHGQQPGRGAESQFRFADEAMAAMLRISGWKHRRRRVQIDADATLSRSNFRFALDVSQLPRPVPDRRVRPVRLECRHRATQQIGPEGSTVSPRSRRRPPARRRAQAQQSRGCAGPWVVGTGRHDGIGLVLLFLLTQATNNRELYERNYALLFGLNVVVAGLLLLVIAWIGLRLWMRLRRKRFGSRLLVKLAAVFALAGFAPGVLIYVVSYQFVSRSIESWFDVKVEGALDAGPEPGPVTRWRRCPTTWPTRRACRPAALERARCRGHAAAGAAARPAGRQRCGLFNGAGQLITSASQSQFQLSTAERPTAQQFARRAARVRSPGSRGWTRPRRPPPSTMRASRYWCWCPIRVLRWWRAAFPAGDAGLAWGAGHQCAGGDAGLPRVPGALAGARGPQAHVHRHADAEPFPGGVWRRAAGRGAGQPDRAPAAAAGRWCEQGCSR